MNLFFFLTLFLLTSNCVNTQNTSEKEGKFGKKFAQYSSGSVEYVKAVKVIHSKCIQCHDQFLYKNEQEWLNSPYIMAGEPHKSFLFKAIRGSFADGNENMPPQESLSEEEISDIEQWITNAKQTHTDQNIDPIFSKVKNILKANCLGCHAQGSINGNLDLTRDEWLSSDYLTKGDSANSPLYRSLKGSNVGGSEKMPVNRNPLTADELLEIQNWIDSLEPTQKK